VACPRDRRGDQTGRLLGLARAQAAALGSADRASSAGAHRDGTRLCPAQAEVAGLAFLILGGSAKALWFDAKGMTPLTARLFASPLIGLGLGMALVSRATDWREIMIPAMGMVTIGVLATLAIVLSGENFAPQSPLALLVAALPLILLMVGLVLLRSRPRPLPKAA